MVWVKGAVVGRRTQGAAKRPARTGAPADGSRGSVAQPGGSRPRDESLAFVVDEFGELSCKLRCCGEGAGCCGGVRVAVQVGNGCSGFAGDENACGGVPGLVGHDDGCVGGAFCQGKRDLGWRRRTCGSVRHGARARRSGRAGLCFAWWRRGLRRSRRGRRWIRPGCGCCWW